MGAGCFRVLFMVAVSASLLLAADSADVSHGGMPAQESETAPKDPPFDPTLEQYEGSKEKEAQLTAALAEKFALLQTSFGAMMGKNQRDTHAKGVCLDGTLEISDLKDHPELKVGPFKNPQKVPVPTRIRFANADGMIKPDGVPDVRAVSFSFEVGGQRQDLSMNNDEIFAFGNLTDFNNYMAYQLFLGATLAPVQKMVARVPDAVKQEKLKEATDKFNAVFFRKIDPKGPSTPENLLNADILATLKKVQPIADRQRGKAVYSYQTENYWSNTAFLYGPGRAARFRLVQCGNKEPRHEWPSDKEKPNFLREHLEKDDPPCFDLEVQLLDAGKMKDPHGNTLTAQKWVEDASLNWDKAGATSVKVATLRGKPGTLKDDAECDDLKNSYDVSKYHFPDLKPIGVINRGRGPVEEQSQHQRDPNVAFTPSPPAHYTKTAHPDQGWEKIRESYWYEPQGSYLVPYDLFLSLKDPDHPERPFTESLNDVGFINSGYPSQKNPDSLPIGFAREHEASAAFPELHGKGDYVGVTCAACHTGQLVSDGTRHIIDGAPACHLDLTAFSVNLERAMKRALDDSGELNRINDAIKARNGHPISRDDLQQVYDRQHTRDSQTFFLDGDKRQKPINPGPCRTDAFNVILNEMIANNIGVPQNASPGTAPVKFPPIWTSPYLKRVQYGALAPNPFERNAGETNGVHAHVNVNLRNPSSNGKGFLQSTARGENLIKMEEQLRELRAPKWTEVFGKFKPDQIKAIARGKVVYDKQCLHCHTTDLKRKVGDPQDITLVPGAEFNLNPLEPNFLARVGRYVGTDMQYFANLGTAWGQIDPGPFKGTSVFRELFKHQPDLVNKVRAVGDTVGPDGNVTKRGPLGQKLMKMLQSFPIYGEKANGVMMLAEMTQAQTLLYMVDHNIAYGDKEYMKLANGALPGQKPPVGDYKARSLDGVWAWGPYLHNGSVRTLRDLLKPSYAREKYFAVGGTEYDQNDVGFKNSGPQLFKANKPGNLNTGHDFGTSLPENQKEDLLWYLKSI